MSPPVAIAFAMQSAVPAGRQVAYKSEFGLEDTMARLKAEILARDLWVLAELNPQMLLAKGGFEIPPARQIFYFHPRFMSRLLAANAAAIVEAPLKFVLLSPPGEPVSIRHPDIAASFAGYEGLSALAAELAALTSHIALAATKA